MCVWCVCVWNAVSSLCGSNLGVCVLGTCVGRGRSYFGLLVCVLASAVFADAVQSRPATVSFMGGLRQRMTTDAFSLTHSTGLCDPQHGVLPTDASRSAAAIRCQLVSSQRKWHRTAPSKTIKAHVHFVGCVRDAAQKLTTTMLPFLDTLTQAFAEHEVSLYENDSQDQTRMALLQWVRQPSAAGSRSLLLPDAGLLQGERTERLASCRNTLLRFALQPRRRQHWRRRLPRHPQVSSAAFLVVLDLDCKRPVGPTPVARAVASMMASARWDVLTGNSLAGQSYYDLWALRSSKLGLEYDCWRDGRRMRVHGSCDAYEVHLNPHAPVFEVASAFNGLAVYRLSGLQRAISNPSNVNSRHKAVESTRLESSRATIFPAPLLRWMLRRNESAESPCAYDGSRTCEHVPFHTCLSRRGLRLGVAPFLVQGCGNGAPRPPPPAHSVHMLRNGTVVITHNDINATTRSHYMDGGPRPSWWERIG